MTGQKAVRRRKPAAKAAFKPTGSFRPEDHRQMIAEAAWYRAEKRGFEAGYELNDWLAAENEIALLLDYHP